MFKYIKWELKDYFNKKQGWFIFFGVVFLLVGIFPYEAANESDLLEFFRGLIYIAYSLIIGICFLASFIVGSKKAVDTFNKKTFLLESMIPQPVKKILLSKFILGIILNLLYSLITIIGISVLIVKGAGFDALMKALESVIENVKLTAFLRLSLTYVLSTITFMALIVFGYVVAKVLRPSGKGSKVIGGIIWIVVLYTFSYIVGSISESAENIELVLDVSYAVISVAVYFITAWLIENKLEIYN